MTDWRVDDGLRWRELAPFGAEIDHDLSDLPAREAARFVALFRKHGLIVARGQKLSRAQQQAVSTLLGPQLHRTNESGFITTEMEHSSATAEYPYHSDGAYTANPFEALSLHALDVVDGASSTRFVSAERGYETLPDGLRVCLTEHSAEMIKSTYDAVDVRAYEKREPSASRFDERDAIRTHPHSGKHYIAVNELQTARLLGMEWEESHAVLRAVFDHLYAPANEFEHIWRNGDFVIWDNIALQHARGSLQNAGRRILQRVIIGGEDC